MRVDFNQYLSGTVGNKIASVSERLQIQPLWLVYVMYFESRCNPAAVNSTTGATGLIQFMPATANSLGTTTAALKQMSFEDQLDYVYLYLKPYTGKMVQLIDVYLAVFYPAAIGKPDSYVLESNRISAATIARQNPIFDPQKKGYITKGDVKSVFVEWIEKKK